MEVTERLPLKIDPLRYAKSRRELQGAVSLSDMPRLQDLLADQAGEVAVKMSFKQDDDHRVLIDMCVTAMIPLTCQRCLQKLLYPIDISVEICPIQHEREISQLPEHYEPVMMAEDGLVPVEMVEEELLLNIPPIPMHADNDCAGVKDQAYYSPEQTMPEKRHNPFAVLAQFKTKRNL